MRLASCLLLGAALTVGAAPLRADHPDTLYMKNGDRLTGTIKKLNAGALQVSLDYADGTVAIGWNRVQRIGSPNLFIVYMADGEVYSGRLAILPSDETDSVRIQITTGEGERVLIDKRQIAALGSTSDTFWGRFSGNVASGLSYTKGNTNTAFSFSSSVLYVRPRWNAGLTFNSNLSSAEGADRSTRNQGGLSASHLLRHQNWFYAGYLNGLQSSEQEITLQATLGGGVGRYLRNTSDVKASLVAGLTWQSTAYSENVTPGSSEDLVTALLNARMSYVRFKQTSFYLNANAMPALNDWGRIFYNVNATYYLQLFGELDWNLSFYGNWDTRPPAGSSGSDLGLNSGLSISFGDW
ncbi:MAG TPA: DUF481 domain-containing protein [Gemmatimonadales bacterium]|nr:DUF481 domain-containing protein [Gemmatimonadales bacterium]